MTTKYLTILTLSLMICVFIITFSIGKILQHNTVSVNINNQVITAQPVEILNFNNNITNNLLQRNKLLLPLINTVNLMKEEQLPFDEPRTEYGQQDGKLRNEWYKAYYSKKSKYKFNGDTYYVFNRTRSDKRLYPLVPEVCSDFIVDTIDRAAGTWYYPSTKKPLKVAGNIDLRKEALKQKLYLRRLTDLVKFMKSNPEYFEIVFEGKGPEIGNSKKLKYWLATNDVQIYDIVIISGKTPWDPKVEHSHSFFITQIEDGYVKRITGNAGIVAEWKLEVESRRSPLRTVRYIIRIRDAMLERIAGAQGEK